MSTPRKAGRSVRHGPVTVGRESAEFYFTIACKWIKEAGRIVKRALDDVRNGPPEPLLAVTPDVLLAVTDIGGPEWKELLTGLRMEVADAATAKSKIKKERRWHHVWQIIQDKNAVVACGKDQKIANKHNQVCAKRIKDDTCERIDARKVAQIRYEYTHPDRHSKQNHKKRS